MLKKGQPLQFKRPMSSMRQVLSAIEDGHITSLTIREATKLNRGQVSSAIENLAYIGAILTGNRDEHGRAFYTLPGQIQSVAPCLKGVSSIFHTLTKKDNKRNSPEKGA